MEHRWYAIQVTAGHENKVRQLIQRKIDADAHPPEDRAIRQALVPTQEVVEIKNGKKVPVERKLYPGYVLVRSEEHTSELQSRQYLVCRLLLEKKKNKKVSRETISGNSENDHNLYGVYLE